MLTTFVDKSIA